MEKVSVRNISDEAVDYGRDTHIEIIYNGDVISFVSNHNVQEFGPKGEVIAAYPSRSFYTIHKKRVETIGVFLNDDLYLYIIIEGSKFTYTWRYTYGDKAVCVEAFKQLYKWCYDQEITDAHLGLFLKSADTRKRRVKLMK